MSYFSNSIQNKPMYINLYLPPGWMYLCIYKHPRVIIQKSITAFTTEAFDPQTAGKIQVILT